MMILMVDSSGTRSRWLHLPFSDKKPIDRWESRLPFRTAIPHGARADDKWRGSPIDPMVIQETIWSNALTAQKEQRVYLQG